MKYKLYPLHNTLTIPILLGKLADNCSQYLTLPHLFWTQSGHSYKAALNFKRKAKDLDGHKTGHNLRWYFLKIKKWIFLSFLLILLGSVLPAEKKAETNPWQCFFIEPIEIIYVIMKDERIFRHTDHDGIQVGMDAGRLEKELKKEGYEIEDIAIVIHNHLKVCRFSSDDHKRYRRLKKYGFKGLFLVYCHTSDKVYDIEDKDKSRS